MMNMNMMNMNMMNMNMYFFEKLIQIYIIYFLYKAT